MKVCTVEGCGRRHTAKGYCAVHYQKFVRPSRQGQCSVEGCDRKRKYRELCNSHYLRLHRYGDPLAGGEYLDWRNRWRRIQLGDGVAYVTLTKGYVAVIDAADFAKVGQHLWQAVTNRHGGVYARTTVEGKFLSLHRLLLDVPESMNVDHKDGDGLNCRRSNMRPASQARNCQNQRLNRRNTSGYKGVSWQRDRQLWQAGIKINRKGIALGRFDTAEEAARAYDDAARRLFGEFACVNFPIGDERPARLGQPSLTAAKPSKGTGMTTPKRPAESERKPSTYTASSPYRRQPVEIAFAEDGRFYTDDDFATDSARIPSGYAELRERARRDAAQTR